MKLVVYRIQQKSDNGDYAEFEEMRESLLAFANEGPANNMDRATHGANGSRLSDFIQVMSILAS